MADHAEYPDDGHIFVCVRVRDISANIGACAATAAAASGAAPPPSESRKTIVREAQRICVSTIENIVVMHDPKTLDDAGTVARDANNVVQLLTDRADHHQHFRKTTGSDTVITARTRSSRKNTTGAGGGRGLTSTGTASYYECDKCLASMDEASMLKMPVIRNSDFLQPPPYGSQEDVYRSTAIHAVQAAVEGINSCVFAYGQTGSGKTYTLFGDTTNIRRDPGVVPRTISDLFTQLEGIKATYASDAVTDYSYAVSLSFFEIYQNEVYCLLSHNGPLYVQFSRDVGGKRETMTIQDLQQHSVASAEKAYPLIEMGLRRRQTCETGMNARSSRSHAILQVRVAQWRTNRDTRETVELNATINLVDLAGSERQRTSNTHGKSREEGIQINRSLATLARVINDIARGAKFVNYRDSLLTMVLKDNLGGNSKTFMIATVSPVSFNYLESCATLLYAKDVRKIRNRPIVNRTFQTRANLLEQNSLLKRENEKLKEQMEAWMKRLQKCGEGGGDGITDNESIMELAAHSRLLLGTTNVKGDNTRSGSVRLITGGMCGSATEAFVSSTSAGLTAPLLISSHRRYRSVAGIGGTCVEGGVVRVTALVKESMRFDVCCPAPPQGHKNSSSNSCNHTDSAEDFRKEKSTICCGSLELERATQRSCEQRFWVRFQPSDDAEAVSRIIDVQINGRSLGTGRRELSHGDVMCAYLEDSNTTAATQEQSLLSFHFVDLNCLSRAVNGRTSGDSGATLAQLAVSVDIPEGMEHLTIDDIHQLQRDNAKLLDMVRQQTDAMEFQCQRDVQSRVRLSGVATPSCEPSPSPRPLIISPAPVTPAEYKKAAAQEPFHRTTASPSIIRTTSVMRCDVESAALLQRAEQSVSQRLDSAMRENKDLHKAVTRRNETLEALARRLAALEAGENDPDSVPVPPPRGSTQTEISSCCAHASVSISPSALREDEDKENRHVERSLAAVSSPSSSSEGSHFGEAEVEAQAPPTTTRTRQQQNPSCEAEPEAVEKLGDGRMRIFFENSEGDRERYHAAVRERAYYDRIAELETLIDELRSQLALTECRLRVAQDDTLEQQILREDVESDLANVTRELEDVRAEVAQLARDNASLEVLLKQCEEALHAATALNDEEVGRQLAVMRDQVRALRELARLWKRRTMKYIAMGYGNLEDVQGGHLHGTDPVPWDVLATVATATPAKKRLGASGTEEQTRNAVAEVDLFEKATALDAVVALESALRELENENQRLLDVVRRCEADLQHCRDLIELLKRERDGLEKEAANASASEEESLRLKRLLEAKCQQLIEAECDLSETQRRLNDAVQQSKETKRKAVKNNELLLAQQRGVIMDLERQVDQLQINLSGKDDELRSVLQYVESSDQITLGDDIKDYQLRNRIEDILADELCSHKGAVNSGYSAFPSEFQFSEELIALIRICLRVLLDKLKVELYVINRQNLRKYELLVPSVQLRPEAQFHSFIHELRGVVVEVAGKAQRIGGKWSISEADIMSNLVDHRRRRAGSALNGLLIWYDHWDLAPKTEHVCYMELIRNTERIMQIARLVRQESFTNTNATSTLLLPIPGDKGASDLAYVSETARQRDTTVQDSRKILGKMGCGTKSSSNLAKFCASPSKMSAITPIIQNSEDDALNEGNQLRRTATALVMAQTTPFSRTASSQHLPPQHPAAAFETSATSPCDPPYAAVGSTPLRRTNTAMSALGGTCGGGSGGGGVDGVSPAVARAAGIPPAPLRLNRSSTACVLAASEADVNYVATTDVARVESINSYKFQRRMSAAVLPTSTITGTSAGIESHHNNSRQRKRSEQQQNKPNSVTSSSTARKRAGLSKLSSLFGRCQTAAPALCSIGPTVTRKTRGGGDSGGSPKVSRLSLAGSTAKSHRRSDGNVDDLKKKKSSKMLGTAAAASVTGPLSWSTLASAGSKKSNAASKSDKPSSTLAFGRSCTAAVVPSLSLSKQTKAAGFSRLALRGEVGGRAALLSPNPRTPVGSRSLATKDGALPTHQQQLSPFYNPVVLEALRERSSSEVNVRAAGAGMTKGAPLSFERKKVTRAKKKVAATAAATAAERFQPTRTRLSGAPRLASTRLSESTIMTRTVYSRSMSADLETSW